MAALAQPGEGAADLSGWTPRALPDRAPMPGRLVRLVGLNPEQHGADLWTAFGGAGNPSLWDYIADGPFADEAAFRDGLARIASRPDWTAFAMIDQASGRALGMASYMRVDADNGSAEVGCIVLGDGLRRRPGASEAMLLMGERIFERLGYRRYEWKCDARNHPSRRAAERLGFVYEGTFRNHMVVKGRNRDTAWFSITAAEWPAVRAALGRWLEPGNFDADGRQRRPLGDFRRTAA